MTSHVVEEQALKVNIHKETSTGRDRGRGGFRGRRRGRGALFDKASVECYHCYKFSHFQYECPDEEKETKMNFAKTEEEMILITLTKRRLTQVIHGT